MVIHAWRQRVPVRATAYGSKRRRAHALLMMAGALLSSGELLAQAPPPSQVTAQRQWLQRAIANRSLQQVPPPARAMTDRVTTAPSAGGAMPTPAAPDAGAAAPAPPPPPPAVEATTTPDASPASETAASQLLKGEVYRVNLQANEERIANNVLASQLGAAGQAQAIAPFPGLVRQMDQQEREVNLKPYVLAGHALAWAADAGEFVGDIRIGVADIISQVHGRRLSAPLVFEVVESGIARPAQVEIDRTSPPMATIRISSKAPADPFTLRVVSSFEPAGIPIQLQVEPTLFVSTERRTIQGMGFETTQVHVSSYGADKPQDTVVTLTADPSAYFAQSRLRLDAQGRAETTLRSDSGGSVSLSATAPGFASVPASVQVATPWRTLAFSVAGGLLGGLIRLLPQMRRGKSIRRWWIALLVSVLTGALVFGLMLLGVNVFPVEFAVRVGQVFVFVVSALGAWAGVAALKLFSPSA